MLKTLLKKSWQITINNPLFWVFGFFSLFLWTNEINLLISNLSYLKQNFTVLFGAKIFKSSFDIFLFKKIFTQFTNLNFLLIFLPLFLLFILGVICQILLIKGIFIVSKNERENSKNFFKLDWPTFFSIFLLNLINSFFLYIFLTLLGLPFVYLNLKTNQNVWLIFYIIFNLFILLPLSLLISFLIRFSIIERIVETKNLFFSLKKAFLFFIKNWLQTIILSISLFVIGIIFGFILLFFISTSFLFFLILGSLSHFTIITLGLFFVIFLICFLSGIFSTFQTAVWVLFYKNLTTCEKKLDNFTF
jgi:hypothetical protein